MAKCWLISKKFLTNEINQHIIEAYQQGNVTRKRKEGKKMEDKQPYLSYVALVVSIIALAARLWK